MSGSLLCNAIVPNRAPLQTMPPRKVAPRASGAQPVPRMNASRTPSSARARAQPRASVGSAAGLGQRYGIATHDALFKYVLMDDAIRPSFCATSGLEPGSQGRQKVIYRSARGDLLGEGDY